MKAKLQVAVFLMELGEQLRYFISKEKMTSDYMGTEFPDTPVLAKKFWEKNQTSIEYKLHQLDIPPADIFEEMACFMWFAETMGYLSGELCSLVDNSFELGHGLSKPFQETR